MAGCSKPNKRTGSSTNPPNSIDFGETDEEKPSDLSRVLAAYEGFDPKICIRQIKWVMGYYNSLEPTLMQLINERNQHIDVDGYTDELIEGYAQTIANMNAMNVSERGPDHRQLLKYNKNLMASMKEKKAMTVWTRRKLADKEKWLKTLRRDCLAVRDCLTAHLEQFARFRDCMAKVLQELAETRNKTDETIPWTTTDDSEDSDFGEMTDDR